MWLLGVFCDLLLSIGLRILIVRRLDPKDGEQG
jgi:hypothetical protein